MYSTLAWPYDQNAVVRILDGRYGEPLGIGFVVTNTGILVTCAHVLNSSKAMRPNRVWIEFPSLNLQRSASVLVLTDEDLEDVAILRVHNIPAHVTPLPLGSSLGSIGHRIFAVGSGPDQLGPFLFGDGHVTMYHERMLHLYSTQITTGFSGGPLWDCDTRSVIGVIREITNPDQHGRGNTTSFATSIDVVISLYDELFVTATCPYRGLEAFEEKHAEFFFGRSETVAKLSSRLRERALLVVAGPSGCGKSSLVQAGLLPRYRKAYSASEVIVIRPAHIRSAELGKYSRSNFQPLLIVVDQFEEVLTRLSAQDRKTFLQSITVLVQANPLVRFVLVMRDDFYSILCKEAPPELIAMLENRGIVNVPAYLTEDQLSEIVRSPARRVGLVFEPGLIELILRDALEPSLYDDEAVGRSTVLPLLEFALTQLWQRRQGSLLTHEAYRLIGGVTGALAARADSVLGTMEVDHPKLVQKLMTRLVNYGDTNRGIPDSRRRVRISELCTVYGQDAVTRVISYLTDNRLLVTSREGIPGDETVELIHEALIREWPRLRAWLDDDREFLAWHQTMSVRAEGWAKSEVHESKPESSGKLLRGDELSNAALWLQKRVEDLSPVERTYIERSLEFDGAEKSRYSIAIADKLCAYSLNETRSDVYSAFLLAALLSAEALRHTPTPTGWRCLLDNLDRLPRQWRVQLDDRVTAIAYHPETTDVVVGTTGGKVCRWNPTTGSVTEHTYGAKRMWLSSDGSRVALHSPLDSTLVIRDTSTDHEISSISMPGRETFEQVVFSPNNQWVACCTSHSPVILKDLLIEGGEVQALPRAYNVRALAFSLDSEKLVAVDIGHSVWRWALPKLGKPDRLMGPADDSPPVAVAVHPTDGSIFWVNARGHLRWVAQDFSDTTSHEDLHDKAITKVLGIPHGDSVALITDNGELGIYDLGPWHLDEISTLEFEDKPTVMQADGEGRFIFIGCQGGMVSQLEMPGKGSDGVCIRSSFRYDQHPYRNERLTSHLGQLAVLSPSDTVEVILQTPKLEEIDVARFSTDGEFVISGSSNGVIRMWRWKDRKEIAALRTHSPIVAVVAGPGISQVGAALEDGSLLIWNPYINEKKHRFKFRGTIKQLSLTDSWLTCQTTSEAIAINILNNFRVDTRATAVSSSGNCAAWTQDDGIVVDVGSEKVKVTCSGSTITHLDLSASGEVLAAAHETGLVQVWDVTTGKELFNLRATNCSNIAIAPDGSGIAIEIRGGDPLVVSLRGNKYMIALPSNKTTTISHFTKDSQRIVLNTGDNYYCEWLWRHTDIANEAILRIPRNLTPSEWKLYLGDEPFSNSREFLQRLASTELGPSGSERST